MNTKTAKLLKVEKVTVSSRGIGNGTVALGCEYNGARYHVWLHPDTLKVNHDIVAGGPIVYKNPLVDDRKHPDHFNTRTLKMGSEFTDALLASMLHAYQTKNLLAKFEAQEAKEEADRKAKNAAYARLERMRAAAEEMYAEIVELGKGLLGKEPKARTPWEVERLEFIGEIIKKIG